MIVKKKLVISFCSLLIILNLINCVFFEGSKISCALNVLAMVFAIISTLQNTNKETRNN